MDLPLVSVIIPVYNTEKYILETVESVLKQTYRNLEVIIVDDASTDGTLSLLENIVCSRPLKIIQQKNGGASAARNRGYIEARGEFIKFLDGDDLLNPHMVEHQVGLAENQLSIISAKWGRFYKNDTSTFELNPEDCWQTLPPIEWICSSWKNAQSMTNPGIFLIPNKVIEKAGLWDESLSLLDDMEFFTRIILASDRVIFSDCSILFYRSGNPGSLSGQISDIHARSACRAVIASGNCLVASENSDRTKRLWANSLQQLLYSLYPDFPDLYYLLQEKIKELGGSTIEYPFSKKGKAMEKVLGWKLTKKITKWRL